MDSEFKVVPAQLINVFQVTQIASNCFLEDVLGLDHIKIAPDTLSEVHRHNQSDNIIYVIRGKAHLLLDGVKHDVGPGLRVFIPRGMSHGFKTSSEGLEFISAQIPPILDKRTGHFDREIVE